MSKINPPPYLRLVGPDPRFEISARYWGWSEVRRLAERAGCELSERRIGLITKRFTVRGPEKALQHFSDSAWHSDMLGPQFHKAAAAVRFDP